MSKPQERIGEYVLDQPLGTGAFGQVWLAHHHVWVDQLVAVKVPTDPTYLRTLQREGAAIHGLEHPNIVRALGFDPYAEVPYLVMEYVPGTSLRPIIARARSAGEAGPAANTDRPSIHDSAAIMQQILAGLKYAHSHGVIHGDLKPENVLCHRRVTELGYAGPGIIKLTDFGLGLAGRKPADSAGSVWAGSIAYSASINDPAARELAGTLDYMAPERRSGQAPADARGDLYACGVILFELLTGEKPAGTEVPSDLNKQVPPALDEVFRRSYARLEKRYDSASEFADALRIALATDSQGYTPAMADQRQRSTCPNCRGRVDATDQFCIHCGQRLVAIVPRCPQCGAYPDRDDHFCIFCGTPFAAQVAI
jgi:serine/threonine-protein kinase